MIESGLMPPKKRSGRFCSLGYQQKGNELAPPPSGPAILLAILYEGSLSLFVNPDWHKIVPKGDRPEVESLLKRFAEQSHVDPLSYFERLSMINFGRLVTIESGYIPEDALYSRHAGFLPLR